MQILSSYKLNNKIETFLHHKGVWIMNSNMVKSRKAISPILATLLLIVIAVAAIIVTYAWVMTYMSASTSQAGVMLRKDTDRCLWKTGNVTIYVRNIGTSEAEIDMVYINSQPQASASFIPSTKRVAENGGTIIIVVTFQWTTGTAYHFTISPRRGEPLNFIEAAP
jgi:flagellin-like protein